MKKMISLLTALVCILSIITSAAIVTSASEAFYSDAEEHLVSNTITSWTSYAYNISPTYKDGIKAGAVFECDIRLNDVSGIDKLVIQYRFNYDEAIKLYLYPEDFDANGIAHISGTTTADYTSDVKALRVTAYCKNGKAGTEVYVSNFSLKLAEPKVEYALSSGNKAFYNVDISANVTVDGESASGYTYQWYTNSINSNVGGTAISGATSKTYTPAIKDIGGWIYCVAESDESDALISSPARVFADSSAIKSTNVSVSNYAIGEQYKTANLCNTKAYSGSFDTSLLSPGGYFRLTYSGGSKVPEFRFNTWSSTTGKTAINASAVRTGTNPDGTKWAEYSYEDLIAAWGDEDFSELKALQIRYNHSDFADVELISVSWNGLLTSYGDLGEAVECSVTGSQTGRLTWIYTKHVGGTFDTSKLREDGFFYVEYKGDHENAVYMTASSYSDKASTWATVQAREYGETATGHYSIFTVSDIKSAFGEKFRNFDQIRLMANDSTPVVARSASIYLFEGSGALVDDISKDGYDDVLEVPWEKYEETEKNGIAIIGASIQQNPMVTPAALEGAPYYNACGDWNAVLDRTDCVNYGIGGETSTHIATRFDEVLRYDFHTIIMQCGTNDLGISSDKNVVAKTISDNYRKMFEKAKNSNVDIYVIPVLPSTSPSNRAKIEAVDAALETACNEYDFVHYMGEIYGKFLAEETSDTVYVNTDLVYDSIHPNAAGYALISQSILSRIQSTNDSDSTLSGLSYRLSETSAKLTVPGFKTGDTTGLEFDVELPAGTARNAEFTLFATPSDNGATVNGEALEDSFLPITVTLKKGKATATVNVKSADGTTSTEYTVNFKISEYIYEDETDYSQDVDLEPGNTWPYVQYNVNYNETVFKGAKIEFDVELDSDFTGNMYNELSLAWVTQDSKILTSADFENNVAHITYVISDDIDGITTLQIKFGNSGECDYKGEITVSNFTITNGIDPNAPIEPDEEEVGRFTGFISIGDTYHIRIGTGANRGIVLGEYHKYDINGICICGHTALIEE